MKLPTSDPEPTLLSTELGSIGLTQEGPLDAPALFCLHGIPGSHRDFRYLAPYLNRHFRIVRLNMPGFGNSPVLGSASIAGWAEVICAVADALELSELFVAAHSFGGAAILSAASRLPERVAGVALLASPGARMHRGYGAPSLFFKAFAALASMPGLRDPMLRIAKKQYDRRGLKAPEGDRLLHQLWVISSLDFGAVGHSASRLRCPTLMAHCADDPLVEIDIARELAGVIPSCDTLFFEHGGHHLQKTRAEPIAQRLLEMFAVGRTGAVNASA
jgi:pimeloyl-ACP methyl ester carboxylesterase